MSKPREPVDPATTEFPAVERRGRGKLYDEERHPRQRRTDEGWRYKLGWVYRHLVPAIAVAVAAWAVSLAADASSSAEHNAKVARELSARNRDAVRAIQAGRRAAITESCTQDEAIADVLRRALLGFGVGRERPAPPGVVEAFRPLGGLRPLSAERQRERCARRLARGGP